MHPQPSNVNVNECVSNRESKEYVEGLNSKVKLELCKHLVRKQSSRGTIHVASDAGIRLLLNLGQEHMVSMRS